MVPFVIDNDRHRLAVALNALLSETAGKPFDVATAYFSVSGYRLVKEPLHRVGAFRLLLGSEPEIGAARTAPVAVLFSYQGYAAAGPDCGSAPAEAFDAVIPAREAMLAPQILPDPLGRQAMLRPTAISLSRGK